MKILYTEKFKEDLGKPWKKLTLGEVKLREGTLTDTKLTLRDIREKHEFSNSFLETATKENYNAEFMRYPGGIQVHLEISGSDASLYQEGSYYQVILFFYSDMTGTKSLAFILYEELEEDGFTGLKLTSGRNIITIPGFTWECSLDFNQSPVTSFLEDPLGNQSVHGINYSSTGYISLESWKSWMRDKISDSGDTPWLETTYMNNYGIKIY